MTASRWIFSGACSLVLSMQAGAAALYWVGAEDGETMALKWTTGLDVVFDTSVVGSLASVWTPADFNGAAAWVASIPERDLPLGLVESWLAAETSGNSQPAVVEERVRPDRGRDRTQQEIVSVDPVTTPVPEPAAALLGGLAALALLLRRR